MSTVRAAAKLGDSGAMGYECDCERCAARRLREFAELTERVASEVLCLWAVVACTWVLLFSALACWLLGNA